MTTKQTVMAAACLFLSLPLGAQRVVNVHGVDERVDTYPMEYVSAMWPDAENGRHMIEFTFPAGAYSVQNPTPEDDVAGQFLWSDDATEEQRAAITELVDNLVGISGGTAWLGAQNTDPAGRNYQAWTEAHEAPVHAVLLDDFYLGRYPVTVGQWRAIMGSYPGTNGYADDLPAEGVTYDMAMELISTIEALSGIVLRLPTESEWEYAARGGRYGTNMMFAGSDTVGDVAWTSENAGGKPHAIGLLQPNSLGLYDMSGNVLEWVTDWYGAYPEAAQPGYKGPEEGTERVVRGGCYLLGYKTARCSFRTKLDPSTAIYMGVKAPVGVRLAYDFVERVRIDLASAEWEAPKEGGEFTIEYVCNREGLVAEGLPSWLTFVDATLEGATFIAAPNTTGDERTATFTLTVGGFSVEVTVIQPNMLALEGGLPSIVDLVKDIVWSPEATETQRSVILSLAGKLIPVEGGEFAMGAIDGDVYAQANEKPAHPVRLSAYYLSQFETTREEWLTFMDEDPSFGRWDMQLPEDGVEWNLAKAFVDKLNSLSSLQFTLPTEAQWEYAARGGNHSEGYIYSGSNDANEVAWTASNANGSTRYVGTKAPNELGFHDMSGNVYEWTADWYGEYSATDEAVWNPTGPAEGTERVGRGGCQAIDPMFARATARQGYDPASNLFMGYIIPVGVRLAMNYALQMSLHLDAEADMLVVDLGDPEIDAAGFRIPADVDWVSAELLEGGRLAIHVQPNYSGEVRTGTFLVETYAKNLEVTVEQEWRESTLNDVIPQEILDLIGDDVITVHPGTNPPNIEGTYLCDDHQCVATNYDGIGSGYSDKVFRFSNQTSSNLVDFDGYQSHTTDSGNGMIITGEGEYFTAYINQVSTHTDGSWLKTATVYSGRKTSQGIEEYEYTFVAIEKDDPGESFVPVGTYRTFTEGGDGIAHNTTWGRSVASRRANGSNEPVFDSQSILR